MEGVHGERGGVTPFLTITPEAARRMYENNPRLRYWTLNPEWDKATHRIMWGPATMILCGPTPVPDTKPAKQQMKEALMEVENSILRGDFDPVKNFWIPGLNPHHIHGCTCTTTCITKGCPIHDP